MAKSRTLVERLQNWGDRRRVTAKKLDVQQKAGAYLILDAFDDLMLEVVAEVENAKADKNQSGWLTADEAALALKVTENTIRRWGRDGKILIQQPAGPFKTIRYWVEPKQTEIF
jgi:hypothetical protein